MKTETTGYQQTDSICVCLPTEIESQCPGCKVYAGQIHAPGCPCGDDPNDRKECQR